uniref:Uncharacterized protein n=1 Tax=Plectus sambesii TaxID=2011161 RepID=A0A914WNC4_9BILA
MTAKVSRKNVYHTNNSLDSWKWVGGIAEGGRFLCVDWPAHRAGGLDAERKNDCAIVDISTSFPERRARESPTIALAFVHRPTLELYVRPSVRHSRPGAQSLSLLFGYSSMLSPPPTPLSTSLFLVLLLTVGVDASEDGEPQHVHQEQVLRVAVVGQQEDPSPSPTSEPSPIQPNSDRFLSPEPAPVKLQTTLLPAGVTGRPTVVEYRFGNTNNQSSSEDAVSEPEPNSAHRNYAAAIWGVVVVLTAAAII